MIISHLLPGISIGKEIQKTRLMEFRYNEIIIWLIPGLYFLCLVCFFVLPPFTDGSEVATYLNAIKEIPDGIVTSAALFFIPFVSFVIGYLINYIASQTEFWLYKFDILKRPSRIILSGKSDRYRLANLDTLLQRLERSSRSNLTNANANALFIKVKQSIDICPLDTYYFKSVFGRNLLCAQVLVLICVVFECFYLKCLDLLGLSVTLVTGLLFFTSWRRNSKIYVKNILSMYMRQNQ